MYKKCSVCKEIKPVESFVRETRKKDGYASRCKECHKMKCTEYLLKNPERRQATTKKYYAEHKEKHILAVVKWVKNNPDKIYIIKKRTRIKNSEKVKAYVKKFGAIILKKQRTKFPDKYKARNYVNNAVHRNVLPKVISLKCITCGEGAKHYHHKKGYDRRHWLNVEPMCVRCHKKAEKILVSA